jgi:DNA polymerase III sliding clamp (beta) subunit (PCNA family)
MAYKIQGGAGIAKNAVALEIGAEGVTLFATDLRSSVRKRAFGVSSDEPGRVVFPADRLDSLVKNASGDFMEINVSGDSATVKAGKSRHKITLFPQEDFPHFERGSETPWCEIDRDKFIEAAEIGSKAGSEGQEHPAYLGSMLMRRSQRHLLQTASTDIRRIVVRSVVANFQAEDTHDLLIPTKAARNVAKILRESDAERVEVLTTPSSVIFRAGDDLEFSTGRIDARFPAYENLVLRGAIRDEEETLNAKEFKKCLERIRDLVASGTGIALFMGGKMAGFAPEGMAIESYTSKTSNLPIQPRTYNVKFVLEGLNLFGKDELSIRHHTSTGQLTMGGDDLVYLVMPVDMTRDQIAGMVTQVESFEKGESLS